MSSDSFFYRQAGLVLRSPRALSYLPALSHPPAKVDVEIVLDPVTLPSEPPRFFQKPYRVYSPDLVIVVSAYDIRVSIACGAKIVIDAPSDIGDAELHTILFGPAFGILCHQRGMPPLHASAAVFDGSAVAVMGDSGAGKSTTLRAMMAEGGLLLTDDQLIVSADGMAFPGFPSLKLWQNASDWFCEKTEGASRVRPMLDKYHIRAEAAFHSESAPLKAIFLLHPDPGCTTPTAQRVPRPEAISTLDRLISRSDLAQHLGSRPAIFRWAAAVSAVVPVYRMFRPNSFDQLGAVVRLLRDTAISTRC